MQELARISNPINILSNKNIRLWDGRERGGGSTAGRVSVDVVNVRDCRTHFFLLYQRGADDIKPNIKDYGLAFTFHGSFLLIFSTERSLLPPSLPSPLKTLSAVDRIYISASQDWKYYKLNKIIS